MSVLLYARLASSYRLHLTVSGDVWSPLHTRSLGWEQHIYHPVSALCDNFPLPSSYGAGHQWRSPHLTFNFPNGQIHIHIPGQRFYR